MIFSWNESGLDFGIPEDFNGLRPLGKFVDHDHLPEVDPTLLHGKNSCILVYPLSRMILKGYPVKMKKNKLRTIQSKIEIFFRIISFNSQIYIENDFKQFD